MSPPAPLPFSSVACCRFPLIFSLQRLFFQVVEVLVSAARTGIIDVWKAVVKKLEQQHLLKQVIIIYFEAEMTTKPCLYTME